jgi:hypothetical protein
VRLLTAHVSTGDKVIGPHTFEEAATAGGCAGGTGRHLVDPFSEPCRSLLGASTPGSRMCAWGSRCGTGWGNGWWSGGEEGSGVPAHPAHDGSDLGHNIDAFRHAIARLDRAAYLDGQLVLGVPLVSGHGARNMITGRGLYSYLVTIGVSPANRSGTH